MISAWRAGDSDLRPVPADGPLPLASASWIDVESVTPDEEKRLEAAFGLDIPTREEQKHLELSSRLYREGDALYLASTMLVHTDSDTPLVSTVTCILSRERLITVRYTEPRAIRLCAARLGKGRDGHAPEQVFQVLMEAAVERLGQVLQHLGERIEALSTRIFRESKAKRRSDQLHAALTEVGRIGHVLALVRQSLVEKGLMLGFAEKSGRDLISAGCIEELHLLSADIRALTDQATFMGDKTTFLLDAAVGYISIEQNRIMTVVSVLAVIFMPPTLVAGIYGMNFQFMPELQWRYGYLFAIALMVALVSGIVWFIRKRHWM